MAEPDSAIDIRPVTDKADLERFIRLPWAIYRDDPHWIAPLLFERRQHLSPKTNPFFKNAEVQFWLALRDGLPVGRISAQFDHAALAQHQDGAGHFGLLEAINDPAVFKALFATAEGWLQQRGLTRSCGPFSLSINDETGLLVKGFDHPPYMMMNHAPPYYDERVQALGYAKIRDMIAYAFHVGHRPVPSVVQPMIDRVLQRSNLTLRKLRRDRFKAELESVLDIFNDAWSNNWGFVPFNAAQITKIAEDLKPLIHDDMAWIAEIDGTPVAFALGLPNLNEAIADLNGALLPFGWAKLLYRLKLGKIKSVRMPLMGVRKKYQNGAMGAALAYMVIGAVQEHTWRRGFQEAELSWVLEDNTRARKMIEAAGGEPYKIYRVYDKALT